MLVAQAMGEYAGATVMAQAVAGVESLVDRMRHIDPSTWAMVGLGAFAVWFVVGKLR